MPSFLLPPTPVRSLDEYLAGDIGGLGLKRAQELGPDGTIEEVGRSGLRGRGGAGFPTGRKWSGVAAAGGDRHYVVANAAEGEPGTFKDRALIRANPYQLVEGLMVAALAVGAHEALIGLKAGFERETEALTRAVAEMQRAGICTDCQISIVGGPEEYLFGEEKALIAVLEGNEPLPGLMPPYQEGLQGQPTLVNNAETLSNVPHILVRGAEWFRAMGTGESPGNMVCTVVGDVVAPDVGEMEMGTPLRDVISAVGSGLPAGRSIKAVFSGVANPVLTGDQLDAPLSYEGFAAAGSGLGAAGFIVYDDTACMVEAARCFSRFLAVESCGQCSPCKIGSGEITRLLERIEMGAGTEPDVEEIGAWLSKVTDGARCYLATQEREVVGSILAAFPEEFAAHLEGGACPYRRPLVIPKLVDLSGGQARYDERQARKRPDWTYR